MLQNHKVALKLHPAELGELKVNIQMRDGGVQASIAAQNQRVIEVLEKNMPKLRELMEQQGLKVSDLSVYLERGIESEQNLFEEQLSQEKNGFNGKSKGSNKSTFTLSNEEDELIVETPEEEQNVNVKA